MKKITNIYDEIEEADLSIANIPSILLELTSRIEELEFRLSMTDKMPYPARDSNGELRYEITAKGLKKNEKNI